MPPVCREKNKKKKKEFPAGRARIIYVAVHPGHTLHAV